MHQWPLLLGLVLIGCIAGGLSSLLWPSPYKAKAEIYVALNPYRALSDTTFLALARPKYSNIDDYKNWQMSQLESAVFLEEILLPTLEALKNKDAYWNDIPLTELSEMLSAQWRSAGTWTLIATHPEAQRAEEAIRAWCEVSLKRISQAIDAARDASSIEQQLQVLAYQIIETSLQLEHLETTLHMAIEWQDSLQSQPQDESLDLLTYQHISSTIAQVADFSPSWLELLRQQPGSDASTKEILTWLASLTSYMEASLDLKKEQIDWLNQERLKLAELFGDASRMSLGLSPNLEVNGLRYYTPIQTRPTITLELIGGIGGLLTWVVLFLGQIAVSKENLKTTRDG